MKIFVYETFIILFIYISIYLLCNIYIICKINHLILNLLVNYIKIIEIV